MELSRTTFARDSANQAQIHRAGFTLLELLIALAIAGVLSSVAVPTYRSMVFKARKQEAKIALGQVYLAESAFYSEWGTYGTNLNAIGVEMSRGPRWYVIGFPDKITCDNVNAPNSVPRTVGTIGGMLNAVYPSYYNPPPAGNGPGGQTYISRILPVDNSGTPYSYPICVAVVDPAAQVMAPSFRGAGGFWWQVETISVQHNGAATQTGFRALAMALMDNETRFSAFIMDHNRKLINSNEMIDPSF